ncbi:LysR family transcriptional regulator [Pseudomonas otitidis]|uniref:LysR family transcriptional regulator n=1 Tax=Metapseudomonas otitidis TaxID=319939 RepID=UPI0024495D8A|nr:LysR family transcriptional regulator [Pseudomonas otitidis]MDH1105445.1 LysR family transcriptional regulator [Pseudomonas otitidis]MDH1159678.1 LysR family transcriptional regulator [Pseudomonas otitidis]MDH1162489.1 LysR family transcriptional regulator [Pseudomonas otitidis]
MPREPYSDLLALLAVAEERSFTRAAARLGMSQSMLSHTIRSLEARVGVRLLTRTTRSVSVTEAGEQLIAVVAPRLQAIEAELRRVTDLSELPTGTLRITATEHAIETLLWPRLEPLLPRYPQLNLELHADNTLVDIVQERFDFGVRLGDSLARDITAVRIGPDLTFALVAAPAYLARHPAPATPQALAEHRCINLRLPTRGNLWAWELCHNGQALNVRVDGQLVFNEVRAIVSAAVAGFGLAYVPLDRVQAHLDAGHLVPVLQDWWSTFPGYHLYYSNQRELSRAMQVVIEALRHPD